MQAMRVANRALRVYESEVGDYGWVTKLRVEAPSARRGRQLLQTVRVLHVGPWLYVYVDNRGGVRRDPGAVRVQVLNVESGLRWGG